MRGKDFEKTLDRQVGPAWQPTTRLRRSNGTSTKQCAGAWHAGTFVLGKCFSSVGGGGEVERPLLINPFLCSISNQVEDTGAPKQSPALGELIF